MTAAPWQDTVTPVITRHDTITRPPLKPAYVTKFACLCGFQTDWFRTDDVILAEKEMQRHVTNCRLATLNVTA